MKALVIAGVLATLLACCRGSGAPAPAATGPAHATPWTRFARAAASDASTTAAKPESAVQTGGGRSCRDAVAAYVEPRDAADAGDAGNRPTAAQYGAVLNRGDYFAQCNVPDTMSVMICAAVQRGRAVGVSVLTNPADARAADCIAKAVRGLDFPYSEEMDVARTDFAAQPAR